MSVFDDANITTTEPPFTTTYPTIATTEAKGNATNCVWCGKAMLVSEADSYGRCELDSHYPFNDDGQAEAKADRGEIALLSIYLGILP